MINEPNAEPGYALLAHVARARRRRLRMSQQDVAEAGGPSYSSVQHIERSTGSLTQRTLLKIDTALGWPAGTARCLVHGNDSKAVDNWSDFISFSINDIDAREHTTISEWIDDHIIYSTEARLQQINTYLSAADYHLVCLKEESTTAEDRLQRIRVIEKAIHDARSTVFQWFNRNDPNEGRS